MIYLYTNKAFAERLCPHTIVAAKDPHPELVSGDVVIVFQGKVDTVRVNGITELTQSTEGASIKWTTEAEWLAQTERFKKYRWWETDKGCAMLHSTNPVVGASRNSWMAHVIRLREEAVAFGICPTRVTGFIDNKKLADAFDQVTKHSTAYRDWLDRQAEEDKPKGTFTVIEETPTHADSGGGLAVAKRLANIVADEYGQRSATYDVGGGIAVTVSPA